ncbi:MAG: hypothetical protein K2X80_14750 [Pseudomonadaceae bacterium]|nr:hypothetical protein [Pseudomonadaceae bacterium]
MLAILLICKYRQIASKLAPTVNLVSSAVRRVVWHSVLEVVVGMLLVVLNCYSILLLSVFAPWLLARRG